MNPANNLPESGRENRKYERVPIPLSANITVRDFIGN